MGETATGEIELTDEERRQWLRLIRTERLGPATFNLLLQRFSSAAKAIEALPSLSRKNRSLRLPAEDEIDAELERADRLGARFIASCEPDYPEPLRNIHDAPPILCVCGDASLLKTPAIAIVGARNASSAGRKIAGKLAAGLGEQGLVVVSGLARGIDGAAHEAALDSGTIAVVAGGVDVIYPPEHDELTRQIAARGLLVSETAPGFKPRGRDFPRRNRIISGLSRGVVVVEAAQKSGTLITARFALEQGRDVFAVPGSPLDPRCHGTNKLLRQGAILVENAADILDQVCLEPRIPAVSLAPALEESAFVPEEESFERRHQELQSLLSFTPTHRDDLIRASTLPASAINSVLLDMVLNGEAEEHSGGKYTLSATT